MPASGIRSVAALLLAVVCAQSASAIACQPIPPTREPTLREKIAGLETIFGGTVIGYITNDGTRLIGPLPPQCLDKYGKFPWWDDLTPECRIYLDTSAALFRVDVPIVGPAADEILPYDMTWGDGDCNIDFEVGDKWLVAGHWFTQELHAPIRDSEIAILQRLASRPPFDISTLYR